MKKRSVVLVTVDCLRADRLGFQGYARPVTPFLDALAKTSVVFSDAIVAGAPTYFSFPAIMASRYPLSLGRENLGIAPKEPTIACAFRDAGYATAAFVAGNPYLTPRFGYDQGFDEFRDFLDSELAEPDAVPSIGKTRLTGLNRQLELISRQTEFTAAAYDELYFRYCLWRSARQELSMDQLRRYPAADVLVSQACAWLSNVGERPFFLWMHLMDPHHPYYPPLDALSSLGASHMSAGRARFLNSFWNRGNVGVARLQRYRSEILSLYDAGVHWVDTQMARLVGALQHSKRWDETVFALTADHGEEFLEHGARYHSPTDLPDQLLRVPLLMHSSDVAGMTISNGTFSLIHLAPTLLGASGVEVPGTFHGHDLWEQICAGTVPDEPAVAECIDGCNNPVEAEDRIRPRILAVRDLRYKLVLHFREQRDILYDLEKDPSECCPVPPDVLTKERVRLLKVAGEHVRRATRSRSPELALRSRLRDLRHAVDLRRTPADVAEKTRKVRLLFLPLVDTDNVNAQSLNVREIALRFDPARFEITLWYEREPDARLLNRPGFRLLRLPEHGRTLRILREMLAAYDVIGYMDYSPASYAFLHLPPVLRRGAKAVLHAEAPVAQLVNPPAALRILYDGIVPLCDVYAAITEFVARDLSAVTKREASYILPVGVDTRFFSPPAARTNRAPVVLFAGTLVERKGPQIVLDAAALLPEATFRLVGSGREGYDGILRRRITESSLRNVTLDGPKTQAQLLEIMRSSDIFLLPSRLEGIPKVTLEASATGLPCIVFKDYETPSVVDGVTGFQVGSTEEMMQALRKLISDQTLRDRMGAAARKHVEQFDWDVVGQQWQNAYLEIAAGRPR